MKSFFLVTAALIGVDAYALNLNFDELKSGSALIGWEQGFYGAKGNPIWIIEKDSSAPSPKNVLRQSGQAVYSWLVKPDVMIQDGSVEADMKVISGKEDPEVGLVWRHKDGKNYYYVRINALEDNVIFYRMNSGKKESIKEADTKVGFNKWHHLKIQFKAEQVEVFFNNKPVISVRDKTFAETGRVGFFTTADTVGAFDNFKSETVK